MKTARTRGKRASAAWFDRWWRVAIFIATLAVYALFTPRVLRYTEPPSGDQPYYLQTVISLVEDGDLNEYNNILKRSFDQFYPMIDGQYPPWFEGINAPYPLPTDAHGVIPKTPQPGAWYSKHGTGLPLALLPGWVAGKRLAPLLSGLTLRGDGGWPGTVFLMNLFGALLAVQIFRLAREASGSNGAALAVWGALCFSNPLMTYSYLLFPELPAALLIAHAYHQLWRGWAARSTLAHILTGLGIGFLPWLHFRLAPVVAALVGLAIWDCWRSACPPGETPSLGRRLRQLGLVLGPAALVALGVVVYSLLVRGSVAGSVDEHAGFFNPLLPQERRALLLAGLGLLFDQQYGLLTYAPVYILAVVGLAAFWRGGERAVVGALAALIAPYALVVLFYRVWWGAWCPPARYLTPVLPLLAPPLARALAALGRSRAFRALYAALAGAGALVMAAMIAGLGPRCPGQQSTFFNNAPAPASLAQWAACRLHIDLAPYLPSVMDAFVGGGGPVPWALLAAYAALCAALAAWGLLLLARDSAGAGQRKKTRMNTDGRG